MQLGILKTDHGKHSDEKLAMAVAGDLIKFDDNASGPNLLAGRDLETAIAKIMVPVFANLAMYEQGSILLDGTAHLSTPLEVRDDIFEPAVEAVCSAIAASPLSAQWPAESTEQLVSDVLRRRMVDAHHLHRDWFARWGKVGHGVDLSKSDKHDPNCEHVKGWLAA